MPLGEFFEPGRVHLREETERQRNHIQQRIVDAPPWDSVLDEGRITLNIPRPKLPPDQPAATDAAADG